MSAPVARDNDSAAHVDVCVIGAGPAGAAAANRLARLGLDVMLLDRQAFPRPKIGESLAPSILPVLETLGVRAEVEAAGFLRPEGAVIRWAGPVQVAPAQPIERSGIHVDRARFDDILARAAARAGATVWTGVPCGSPRRTGEGHWIVPVHGGQAETKVKCRFVVDAAGRGGVIGGARNRLMPSTLALYGYWREHGFAGPAARVEAGVQHWAWAAPLAGGRCAVAVFLDSGSALAGRGREDVYRALLADCDLLRPCLEGQIDGGVHACSATADVACEVIGDGWIKVGEAALCVDPLSAQGVQLAIMTGVQAAVVINTMARRADKAGLAQSFYDDQAAYWAHHFQSVSAGFYKERAAIDPQPFWSSRAVGAGEEPASPAPAALSPDRLVKLAADAAIRPVPAIAGDYIEAVPALVHAKLERPMAFVANASAASIVGRSAGPISAGALLADWARQLGFDAAYALLNRLWSLGIIVPA